MSRLVEFEGMREASGALAIPEGSFSDRLLVVNNEDNHLRLYAVRSPRQVQPKVKLGGSKKAWTTSTSRLPPGSTGARSSSLLGRGDNGKLRSARQMLLSVKLAVTADGVRVIGRIRKTDAPLPALRKLDRDLKKAIGDLDERDRTRAKLAPEG